MQKRHCHEKKNPCGSYYGSFLESAVPISAHQGPRRQYQGQYNHSRCNPPTGSRMRMKGLSSTMHECDQVMSYLTSITHQPVPTNTTEGKMNPHDRDVCRHGHCHRTSSGVAVKINIYCNGWSLEAADDSFNKQKETAEGSTTTCTTSRSTINGKCEVGEYGISVNAMDMLSH